MDALRTAHDNLSPHFDAGKLSMKGMDDMAHNTEPDACLVHRTAPLSVFRARPASTLEEPIGQAAVDSL